MTRDYWRTSNSTGGGHPRLHSDPDCKNLQTCEKVIPADKDSHPNAKECPVCTGDAPSNGGVNGGDRSTYEMAREIGESRS